MNCDPPDIWTAREHRQGYAVVVGLWVLTVVSILLMVAWTVRYPG